MPGWTACCIRGLSCAFAFTAVTIGQARAASWLELNFWLEGPHYESVLPDCNAAVTLSEISSRFAQKEREFWNSNLAILAYSHVRETAYRPWDSNLIPRRYCSARVTLSNGDKRPIYYLIGETYGAIGAVPGVEWCVVGYDRNWAYNPACKMAWP